MSLNMHTPDGGQRETVSSYDGKIAGLYDLERTLGSGHFAVVKLARHVFTGEKVAVKVVDKTKLDDVSKAHLFQEVRCMKLVQHPNVVRLYEVIDTQTKLYLILELGDGGDLYDYIMKHEGGLTEDLARKYFRQIVRAISYCHQLHVVHRDLKPANVVFFEKQGVVKLTDFGFSNKFSPGQKLETSCGSLAYSAPEILLGDSYDAPAVDVWSLGVILYMLVCGQPPFEKANDSETLTMIMDCKYSMPAHVTVTCRRLIASMLVRDPEKRATLEQITQDPWLRHNSSADPSNDHLPLVSREQVSEDDHAFIIQKMINGNIATKEEILQSLDRNKYNHITSTYFLLAERRLRQKRQEQVQKHRPQFFLPSNPSTRHTPTNRTAPVDNKQRNEQTNKLMVPVNIEVCNSTEYTPDTAASEKRNRKCSIVKEEDEEEGTEFMDKTELKMGSHIRSSISSCGKAVQDPQYVSKLVIRPKTADVSSKQDTAILHMDNLHLHEHQASNIDAYKKSHSPMKVKSNSSKCDFTKGAPLQQRVNQKITPISENQEAAAITNEQNLSDLQQEFAAIKDSDVGKIRNKNPVLMHRRIKSNKMRTPSCSSSEASDDDTKSRKKKINKIGGDTPTRFRVHRRDSHDDSSDSQDQTNFGSSQGNANNVLNSTNDGKSNSGKKDEHTKQDDTQSNYTKQKKGCSLMENCLPKVSGRRRIRESQSLDRITESQEYEMRHRNNNPTVYHCNDPSSPIVQQFHKISLNSNDANNTTDTWTVKKLISSNPQKSQGLKNVCDINSIEEIDLYIGMNMNMNKTDSKCSVTMKKIRRLGKYFPVVNLS